MVISGLELRIWKGKAIYKKGTLDLKGHFDQAKGHFVQAKGHQGHPRNFRKGTKAKKKEKEKKRVAANLNEGIFNTDSKLDCGQKKKVQNGRQEIR